MWQSDITYFTVLGKTAYIIGFLDDYSRFITGLGVYRSHTSAYVLETYREAVATYGVPQEMLTATGRITTMENRVEGPTAVFITTADPEVDPETRSRFVVLTVDESREQTRAILEHQRRRQTLEALTTRDTVESIVRRHRNFQRLLRPLLVVNPFAEELPAPDDRLQSRRDYPKYLNLIRTVAFLSQMGREVKNAPSIRGAAVEYIEVTRQDIEVAGRMMQEAFCRNPDDLNGVSRALLGKIERMVTERLQSRRDAAPRNAASASQIQFTRREIREFTGWSHSRVFRYLKQLVDFEYIIATRGRNGCLYVYRLASPRFAAQWNADANSPAEETTP